MVRYLPPFIAVLVAVTIGEPVAQGWFGSALQARAGRVCYQRCTRHWQWPSQQCRAHCRAGPGARHRIPQARRSIRDRPRLGHPHRRCVTNPLEHIALPAVRVAGSCASRPQSSAELSGVSRGPHQGFA
jgi:hypothetical protein